MDKGILATEVSKLIGKRLIISKPNLGIEGYTMSEEYKLLLPEGAEASERYRKGVVLAISEELKGKVDVGSEVYYDFQNIPNGINGGFTLKVGNTEGLLLDYSNVVLAYTRTQTI